MAEFPLRPLALTVGGPQLSGRWASPRRRVRGALGWYAAAGTLAVSVIVLAAGRAPVPVGVQLPTAFWGLLQPTHGGGTLTAVVIVVALSALLISWWMVLREVRSNAAPLRRLVLVALAWATPVILAPPLLSLDTYAYLAQGRMLATGVDPYLGGPVLLGGHDVAARVDPMWRASPVPYGPVGLVLLRAVAVVTHDLTTGVLLLRLLAVAGVIVATAAALSLAPIERRPVVFALTALNPITIIHLIGGAHLDAVLAALVVSCLVLARQGRWSSSVVLAAAAVGLKASAGPLLLLVAVAARRAGTSWAKVVGLLLSATLLQGALVSPVVGRPWGFVPALLVPGAAASWYSPSTWSAVLLGTATRSAGLGAGPGQTAGRLAVLLVGAAVVLWCARGDLSERDVLVKRASLALLVTSLCLPAIYGWYLAAALFSLAAVATGRMLVVLVLLCSALLFSSLPPLYGVQRLPLVLTGLLVLLALGFAGRRLMTEPVSSAAVLIGGSTRHRHLQFTARAGMVVLGVAGLTGLPYAPASAGAEATSTPPDRTVTERALLVAQLHAQYPRLQVARIDLVDGANDLRAVMVQPGVGTCEVLFARALGPLAPPSRLAVRTASPLKATDQPTCSAGASTATTR